MHAKVASLGIWTFDAILAGANAAALILAIYVIVGLGSLRPDREGFTVKCCINLGKKGGVVTGFELGTSAAAELAGQLLGHMMAGSAHMGRSRGLTRRCNCKGSLGTACLRRSIA